LINQLLQLGANSNHKEANRGSQTWHHISLSN